MDLNDVKGGKYQLVSVRWDQITSEPGEPLDYIRHRRGDIVDLTAEDAKRLVAAGAVVKPGQLEKTKAEEARALAERAAAEYQAILAGLPEEVRSEVAPAATPSTRTEPAPDYTAGAATGSFNVEVLEKYVGDDREKAAAVLELEKARGDEARSTLVKKLEKLAAPPAS
jgi:hypothetical protein